MTATSNRPSLPDLPPELLYLGGDFVASITRYAMRAVDEALATQPPAPVQQSEAVDMPEDDEAHNAWVTACEVDGIKHSGSAFERGWELALSDGVPEWPTWANQILKVVREHSGYDGYDDQDGVDLVEETSECLRELAAMADSARAELKTTPPAPALPPVARVPLTEEQIIRLTAELDCDRPGWVIRWVRAIEKAHGIEASTGEQSHG